MKPQSILLVHNTYRQSGGEDQVFKAESRLLREMGHQVIEYQRSNTELDNIPTPIVAIETIWSRRSVHELNRIIQEKSPDLVHFHNTFLRISPAAYSACAKHGVPVVQTLHNYRLTCPSANHFRNNELCDDCHGLQFPWPAIIHRCYHKSAMQSGVVTTMIAVHHKLGTWRNTVHRYIALSTFMRDWMIRGGIPAEHLVVKPNFLPGDPGAGDHSEEYALYIGRLSPEKGLITLLRAWDDPDLPPLKIIGDGPLEDFLRREVEVQSNTSINMLGKLDHQKVLSYMKKAQFLVFPSEWFEGLPMVLLESAACALPVLATKIGSVPEVIKHGTNGLLFTPGNTLELREMAKWANQNRTRITEMGAFARKRYLQNYTAERNYPQLLEIYHQAMSACNKLRVTNGR